MRDLFLAGLLAWLFILLVYLVIMPDQIRTEQYEWGRKLQCKELGDRYYKEHQEREQGNPLTIYPPDYAFNKQMNTCIYTELADNTEGSREIGRILDLATNQTLWSYAGHAKPEERTEEEKGQFEEFLAKKQELFSDQ
jgi:hypothetical protein